MPRTPSWLPSAAIRSTLRACARLLAPIIVGLAPTQAVADFSDNFNRPDSAVLGNGWQEKSPGAFALVNGEAFKQTVASGYRDNIVYRPAGENGLDTEVLLEFGLATLPPGYPQVLARVQTDTVGFTDTLDGYILYVDNDAGRAILGRQTAFSFVTTLATVNLSPALNVTDRFRLRLRVTGVAPVQLSAWVERYSAGVWQIIGQATYADGAGSRITAPGTSGFGGYVESNYRYDNFNRLDFDAPGSNPPPQLSSLSPSSAIEGEGGLILTAIGSEFTPASIIRWNGADRTTTFISSTELEGQITENDLAAAGTASVSVFTPAPGGGTSASLPFTIMEDGGPPSNPMPAVTTLAPDSATAGDPAFTLTVNGGGFISDSRVRWNGIDRPTGFVSSTTLTATIMAADVATVGQANVSVFNPAPGGGTSNSVVFDIEPAPNPVPSTGSLQPASAPVGSGSLQLTVFGADFVPGAVVRWQGNNRPTTYVAADELVADLPASDLATAGAYVVDVVNPAPGGGASNPQTFDVTAAGGGGGGNTPRLEALSPLSALMGSQATLVRIFGSGFEPGAEAAWDGSGRPTTVISDDELEVMLSAADLAAVGNAAITVLNPGENGGRSVPLPFFVLDQGEEIVFDGFNRPNGSNIANGWTEKSASAFSLQDGRLASVDTEYDYHDSLVYRPTSEDRRDLELGVEFVRIANNMSFPQLHARVQRDTVQQLNTLESYIFFVDDFETPPGRAIIAVQPPATDEFECYMLDIPFPSALQAGQRYRLRFRVAGVSPVTLTGYVERFTGTRWELFASGTTTHDFDTQRSPWLYCYQGNMPPPILADGTHGFAKWVYDTDLYDNYHARSLNATAATPPAITTLTPSVVTAGGPGFTLIVDGGGFAQSAVVRWNGSGRPTTFVSPTRLEAQISAADIGSPGSAEVTVVNPGPDGGTSGPVIVTINPGSAADPNLVDDFARPDGEAIGNGWIEKNPNAFALINGRAAKLGVGTGYRDNLVYRPAAEDLLDVEASAELRFTSLPAGYPQLMVRAQAGTIANGNQLDGYILYVNNSSTQLVLGRQSGNAFVTTLATISLAAPFNTSDTYRLRLRATGVSQVQLTATVERLQSGAWEAIGQSVYMDNSGARITTAGSVGFGGFIENNYSYDNFQRIDLSP